MEILCNVGNGFVVDTDNMVIVYDDNNNDLEIIKRGLKDTDVKVVDNYNDFSGTVHNGDLIVLDYKLNKGKSGLSVLSEIKQKLPESKVIMISGMNDEVLTKEFIRNGADDFVFKDSIKFIPELKASIKRLL